MFLWLTASIRGFLCSFAQGNYWSIKYHTNMLRQHYSPMQNILHQKYPPLQESTVIPEKSDRDHWWFQHIAAVVLFPGTRQFAFFTCDLKFDIIFNFAILGEQFSWLLKLISGIQFNLASNLQTPSLWLQYVFLPITESTKRRGRQTAALATPHNPL